MLVVEKITPRALIIFFLAALFYFYEFILQVAPSVMATPMMEAFHVNKTGFGVVAAFYFYSYAPMQLPAGLLYNRFGPRKLITFALIICGLGAIFFASTNYLATAALGRFLIGIGSAFSFIGVLVLSSRWFPAKYFALLAGIAQLMSSIGAITGEVPLAYLINIVGWRHANFILGAIGLSLAGIAWLIIRDSPEEIIPDKQLRGFAPELRRLKKICRSKATWLIGLYAFTIWTPIAIFAALWGVPFLQEKYQISVIAASAMCSFIWLGIGISSPFLGWLSDFCCSRRFALIISSLCGLCATTMILYLPGISLFQVSFLMFLFGLRLGGQTVSFAVVKDNNPLELVGTASGFNNLSVLLGGAIFQPLTGVLLDKFSKHFSVIASYEITLAILPLCYLASFVVVLFLKESYKAT